MAIKYYDSLNVTGTTDSYFLGSVGIGTTSPSAPLDVRRSDASGIVAEFHNNVGYGVNIDVESDGGNNTISSGTNQSLSFVTNGGSNERMRIATAGNVGIGTSSPNEKLQVAGNIHAYAPSGVNAEFAASTAAGSTTVAIRSSGVTHFNGGDVGIGTNSPAQKLDVNGNLRVTGDALIEDNIYLTDGLTAVRGKIQLNQDDRDDLDIIAASVSSNMKLFTESVERMRINSSGNVGIGTTSPGAKLQIGSATHAPSGNLANNLLQIKSSSGFGYLTIGNGDVANSTAYIAGASGLITLGSVTDAGVTSEYIRMGNTGNVGIGTTSPSEKLTVSGGANVTGKFAVGISATHASFDLYNDGTSYFNGATTVDDTLDLVNLKVSGAQGTDGQVLTSTGSGVAWEDAGGGSGTVTSIAAGTGLTGGTITTSGTIALNYSGNNNFLLASGTQLTSAADDDVLAIVDVNDARNVKYIAKEDFLEDQVTSVTTGEPSGSDSVINIVSLTQAEYDAGTPVATTLYIIT